MCALPIAFSYSMPAAQDMEDQTVMVWCIHQCSIDQPLVLLQLCFSTVFGSYILSKWRHLYCTKHLCVLSWMEWCQVYNRYFHPLGVTVIDCYIEQHTKHCLKSFRNEKYLVSSYWNLTVYKTYTHEISTLSTYSDNECMDAVFLIISIIKTMSLFQFRS